MQLRIIVIVLSILFTCCFAGCKKYKEMKADKFFGDGYIRGRVFLNDTMISEKAQTLKSGIKILLSVEPDIENYLYSTETDSAGYFIFKELNSSIDFYLKAVYETDSLTYKGKLPTRADKKDLTFILSPDISSQGFFNLSVTDTFGNALPGATVCLYKNNAVAPDSGCIGSLISKTTNLKGQLRFYNLPSERYWMNIMYVANGITWSKKVAMDMPSKGTINKSIVLNPPALTPVNEIIYHLKDTLGGSLPHVNICGFSSWVMANDSCIGHNWQTNTGATGTAVITNVASGSYKVYFKTTSGTVRLTAMDTILSLSENSIIEKTIILR